MKAAIDSSSALHEALREGVRRADITCRIRVWIRPHVTVGKRYRLDEGEIEVDSLLPITYADITPAIARFGFQRSRRPPQGRETRVGRKRPAGSLPLRAIREC